MEKLRGGDEGKGCHSFEQEIVEVRILENWRKVDKKVNF
jgi:hypothetical protein